MLAWLIVLAWDAVIWALIVALAGEPTSLSAANVIFGVVGSLLAVRGIVRPPAAVRDALWLEGTARLACRVHRQPLRPLEVGSQSPHLPRNAVLERMRCPDRPVGPAGLRRTITSSTLLALADATIAGARHDHDAWRVAATLRQRAAPPSSGSGSRAEHRARNGRKKTL